MGWRSKARGSWRILGLALATAVTAGASPSTPEDGAVSGWSTRVRDSAELRTPVMASGVVMRSDGEAARGEVVLLALPTWEEETALEVGNSLAITPIGRARLDAHGRFRLRPDPAVALAPFLSTTGRGSFMVLATGPDGSATRNFGGTFAADGAVRGRGAGGGSDLRLVMDAAATPRTDARSHADATVRSLAGFGGCYEVLRSTYDPVWDVVAELYAGPNARVDFVYEQSAESELGVGVSIDASFGSFSQGFKSTARSGATINFPVVGQGARRVYLTQWTYGQFYVFCIDPMFGSLIWQEYQAKPWRFEGGQAAYTPASTPTANHCTAYLAGGSVTIDRSLATTFSNGVRLKEVIGIDLSTRTGFASRAKQVWSFVSNGRLCGTNALPLHASAVVGK